MCRTPNNESSFHWYISIKLKLVRKYYREQLTYYINHTNIYKYSLIVNIETCIINLRSNHKSEESTFISAYLLMFQCTWKSDSFFSIANFIIYFSEPIHMIKFNKCRLIWIHGLNFHFFLFSGFCKIVFKATKIHYMPL